jgi:hypothetical protein
LAWTEILATNLLYASHSRIWKYNLMVIFVFY